MKFLAMMLPMLAYTLGYFLGFLSAMAVYK